MDQEAQRYAKHVSRNCLDNAATEQAFGHMKDEFFKGQSWDAFDAFKSDLTAYITHWNTKRPQERLV